MHRSQKYNRAFTLLEVVIGMFLMAIVCLSAVNIIVVSSASGSFAKHKMQAMYLIQETIENLRKQPFANISSYAAANFNNLALRPEAAGTSVLDPLSGTGTSLDTAGTRYIFTDDPRLGAVLNVAVTTNTPNTHCDQIIVTVTWNESFFGKRKQVSERAGTFISDDTQAN